MSIFKRVLFIVSIPAYLFLFPILTWSFFKRQKLEEIVYWSEEKFLMEYKKFLGGGFWKFRIFALLLSFVIYYLLFALYAVKQ